MTSTPMEPAELTAESLREFKRLWDSPQRVWDYAKVNDLYGLLPSRDSADKSKHLEPGAYLKGAAGVTLLEIDKVSFELAEKEEADSDEDLVAKCRAKIRRKRGVRVTRIEDQPARLPYAPNYDDLYGCLQKVRVEVGAMAHDGVPRPDWIGNYMRGAYDALKQR